MSGRLNRFVHLFGVFANRFNDGFNFIGTGGGAISQVTNLFSNHRETTSFSTGLGRDNGGIESEQFRIGNQVLDHLYNLGDFNGLATQSLHGGNRFLTFFVNTLHFHSKGLHNLDTLFGILLNGGGTLRITGYPGTQTIESFSNLVQVRSGTLRDMRHLFCLRGGVLNGTDHFIHIAGCLKEFLRGVFQSAGHLLERGRKLPGESRFILRAVVKIFDLADHCLLLLVHVIDVCTGALCCLHAVFRTR